jgi:FkbM family methyltransferase
VYDRWFNLTGQDHPETVIDLGANCGYFTVLASAIGATKIVCVEPDPDNLTLLRANAALNNANCETIAAAIVGTNEIQTIQLYRDADPRLHSILTANEALASGMAPRSRGAGHITVPTITLSQVIQSYFSQDEKIDLVKIDIEGIEWAAVGSMSDDEFGQIRCLTIEADNPMPDDLRIRLDQLGFTVYHEATFWAAVIGQGTGLVSSPTKARQHRPPGSQFRHFTRNALKTTLLGVRRLEPKKYDRPDRRSSVREDPPPLLPLDPAPGPASD